MSSGTAGAAGLTSAAGFSAGASLQPARKHAARRPSAAFRRIVRPTATRFLLNPLPVSEGKDGMAAGSLAGVREQPLSIRFSIVEAYYSFCPATGKVKGVLPQF